MPQSEMITLERQKNYIIIIKKHRAAGQMASGAVLPMASLRLTPSIFDHRSDSNPDIIFYKNVIFSAFCSE